MADKFALVHDLGNKILLTHFSRNIQYLTNFRNYEHDRAMPSCECPASNKSSSPNQYGIYQV